MAGIYSDCSTREIINNYYTVTLLRKAEHAAHCYTGSVVCLSVCLWSGGGGGGVQRKQRALKARELQRKRALTAAGKSAEGAIVAQVWWPTSANDPTHHATPDTTTMTTLHYLYRRSVPSHHE